MPRYLVASKDTRYYDTSISQYTDTYFRNKTMSYFVERFVTHDNKLCLRTQDDRESGINRCVLYSDLIESSWKFNKMETPRYLEATNTSKIIDLATLKEVGMPKKYEFYDKA